MNFRVALIVALGLSAAACGSDDSGGGTGGAAGSAGSAGGSGGGAGSAGSGATGGSSGSGGSSSGVCADIVGYCQSAAEGFCTEYGGTRSPETFTAYEEACKQEQKTWATGSCPRDGAVGACVYQFNGPCSAILFFPPQTAAQAEQVCNDNAGTWTTTP